MKKVLLIALALIMVLAPIARAEGQGEPMAEAQKSFQPFELDGEEVKIGGYLINANNYYKLRDLAALLNGTDKQFNIVFDDVKKQIALELGKPYEKLDTDLQEMKHDKTTAKMVTNTILVDGKEVELKAALIDRNNYVKLRDLGPVVGFNVAYNKETQAIIVDTKSEAKVEEKAEDKKPEDKKEEKSEEKPEEKKEEKKDQVKTTDPNLTPEEIKKYIESQIKAGDYALKEYKLIEENGEYFFSKEDEGSKFKVFRYQLLDKADNDKKIADQTEFLTSGQEINYTWENRLGIYFINADRMGKKSIDILSVLKDFGYSIVNGDKLGLGINGRFLVAPDKSNEGDSALGYISVYGKYTDGSEIENTDEKPLREIPLFRGEAKLINVSFSVYVGDDTQQVSLLVVE